MHFPFFLQIPNENGAISLESNRLFAIYQRFDRRKSKGSETEAEARRLCRVAALRNDAIVARWPLVCLFHEPRRRGYMARCQGNGIG